MLDSHMAAARNNALIVATTREKNGHIANANICQKKVPLTATAAITTVGAHRRPVSVRCK